MKRMLNLMLTGLVAVGGFVGAVLLGTTALAGTGAVLATVGLCVGAIALGVVAAQTTILIVEAIKTENYDAVDAIAETVFETIIANVIRITLNSVVLSSLKTPKVPKFRIPFGRRNTEAMASEENEGTTVYEGEHGPVIVTTF